MESNHPKEKTRKVSFIPSWIHSSLLMRYGQRSAAAAVETHGGHAPTAAPNRRHQNFNQSTLQQGSNGYGSFATGSGSFATGSGSFATSSQLLPGASDQFYNGRRQYLASGLPQTVASSSNYENQAAAYDQLSRGYGISHINANSYVSLLTLEYLTLVVWSHHFEITNLTNDISFLTILFPGRT